MNPPLTLEVRVESFAFRNAFRIVRHVFDTTNVVVAELNGGRQRGHGEAAGVYYLVDDVANMLAAIEHARPSIERGATRADLQWLLPPGGARNALDCAYWELEANVAGVPVWQLAALPAPKPLRTTITLGAEAHDAMAAAARALTDVKALKLKLTGDIETDAARVSAVRTARPKCWIGIDANQGYAIGDLEALVTMLVANDIKLLEQPLARGCESQLDGFARRLPFAADESSLSLADVDGLVGRFDVVNIKPDKCGGLTEGLAMAARAKQLGLEVIVGNMMGTSLSMVPSFVLGQLCDVVDLDGPTFLALDRTPAVAYRDGDIRCAESVWGGRARVPL